MQDIGMTDKQFNGFIRFLIDDLKEAQEETDTERKNKKLEKILENLQSTLEDQGMQGRAGLPPLPSTLRITQKQGNFNG